MRNRIIVALVGIPLALVVFFALPPWCLLVAVTGLSLIGTYEVLWKTKFIDNIFVLCWSLLTPLVLPFWISVRLAQAPAVIFLFIFVVVLFLFGMASPERLPFEKISGVFFAAFIIPFLFSSLIRIFGFEHGRILILIPFCAAWACDAFAFFIGRLFGRHKLIPKVSPNKTVEGAIGGTAGAVIGLVVMGLVLQYGFVYEVNILRLAIYGLVCAFTAQIGDLSMSYIKREYRIKDYGMIMPGHGGVLDRFDSVLFTAPIAQILIMLFPAIR